MKSFAIIGVAGYIAKRHLQAIKDTGNTLIAAMDKSDSVGILDTYFPDADFFVEQERFARFLRKNPPDYFVVCTPNYLHDSHIWLGLSLGAKVICEKPAVVNPWNLTPLFGREVNIIQQLRLNPLLPEGKPKHIKIDYVTPRGKWYCSSWKADTQKSGGLIYNIGIHFIDLVCSIYGKPKGIEVFQHSDCSITGVLYFTNATVDWNLSINGSPKREFIVDGYNINLAADFDDLHTKSYIEILNGRGFRPEEVYDGIETAHRIKICISTKPV